MSRITSKNTSPEVRVRKALHSYGLRYRLHVRNLPGTPDIVLPRFKTVIQVRGCFWHHHHCQMGRFPKSRKEYWENKILGNVARDTKNDEMIQKLGWRLIVVWECEVNSSAKNDLVTKRIHADLKNLGTPHQTLHG